MKYLRLILDFLQRFYDKIILAAVLIGLAVSLAFQTKKLEVTRATVLAADQDLQNLLPTTVIQDVDDKVFALELETDSTKVWRKSFGEGSLFEPGHYVYSMDGSPFLLHMTTKKSPYTSKSDMPEVAATETSVSPDAITDAEQDSDGDGIRDGEEVKAGLNPNNSGDALQDKDGDGFDNLDEYQLQTNLSDPASRPRLATRLRFLKRVRDALDIRLKKVNMNNVPDDKRKWDIFVQYLDQKKWRSGFFKIGEEIGTSGYKIVDAQYKEIMKNNLPEELSEITVQSGERSPVQLVQNAIGYESEESYEFAFLYGKPLKVRANQGGEIPLVDTAGSREVYKLVGVGDNEAEVELVGTSDKFTVKQYSPKDKERYIGE